MDEGVAAELRGMMHGRARPALAYAAAKLRIPDLLAGGPASAEELAGRTGTRPELLRRALRGMAVVGIVAERADCAFELAALGRALVGGAPGSLRGELVAEYEMSRAWDDLVHTLRTGGTAYDHAFGASIWEHQEADPDVAAYQAGWMSEATDATAAALAGAYDFGQLGTVVDVGGGRGALLAEVLRAHPGVRGVLFDRPHVVARPVPALAELAAAGRCRVERGDFFGAVPAGECHVLRIVLQYWGDTAALRLLRRCREAASEGGRLVVFEKVMPARAAEAPNVVMSDLMMLVHMGGRERTVEEFGELFAGAGYRLQGVRATGTHLQLIEGVAGRA